MRLTRVAQVRASSTSSVRAGSVVLAGIVSGNIGNAVFHITAARWLGPSAYGEVASLVTVVGLVSFPLTSLQYFTAQRVASALARGERQRAATLYRSALRGGLTLSTALLVLSLVTLPVLYHTLNVHSYGGLAFTIMCVYPSVLVPIVTGMAQGLQRYTLFAAVQVAAPLIRVALLVPLLVIGLGVTGAMASTFASTSLAVVIAGAYMLPWFTEGGRSRVAVARAFRALLPAVTAVLALTSLTSIDVLVAKVSLTSHEAGLYGAASFVGRFVFYLPSAVVTVLLPRVASRTAVDMGSRRIFLASAGATAAICAAMFLVYLAVPTLMLRIAFGAGYEGASDLLPLFALSMTGYALLNLVFAYDYARGRSRVSAVLVTGAAAELVGFALLHGSGHELVLVSLVSAYVVLGAALAFAVTGSGARTRGAALGAA